MQKEAYLAGVPRVTLRDTTEWTETVQAGWNRVVDLRADMTAQALCDLAPLRDREPPDPSVYRGGAAGMRAAQEPPPGSLSRVYDPPASARVAVREAAIGSLSPTEASRLPLALTAGLSRWDR